MCNSGVDKEEVEKLNKEDLLDKFDEVMNAEFKKADFNGRYHAYLVNQMGEKFVEKLSEEIAKSQEKDKNR